MFILALLKGYTWELLVRGPHPAAQSVNPKLFLGQEAIH